MPDSEIRSALNAALNPSEKGRDLNSARAQFVNRITSMVQASARPRPPSPATTLEDLRRERERRQAEVRGAVEQWCDTAWPRYDFRDEYVALLSDPERLARLAGKDLSESTAAELAESASKLRSREFDDADMGALAYMDHLLNNTITPTYRHVVVDEAQDVSPIEFKLLTASSVNNWFTVLGDTAQRLTPYRGVGSWREVERVFGRSEIERQRARRSYRSSRQITLFNNRILRTFDKNIPAPIPFERVGHRVEFSQYRNGGAMYQGIIDDLDRIRALDGMDDAVIAILVRDQRNLRRFSDFCKERGIDGIALVGQDEHTTSGTVLARIPDAKGLEYDAVMVMGVNETFSDTLFNKKLLYMATTRAKHYLGIHWFGRQSPILASLSTRGVTMYRR